MTTGTPSIVSSRDRESGLATGEGDEAADGGQELLGGLADRSGSMIRPPAIESPRATDDEAGVAHPADDRVEAAEDAEAFLELVDGGACLRVLTRTARGSREGRPEVGAGGHQDGVGGGA